VRSAYDQPSAHTELTINSHTGIYVSKPKPVSPSAQTLTVKPNKVRNVELPAHGPTTSQPSFLTPASHVHKELYTQPSAQLVRYSVVGRHPTAARLTHRLTDRPKILWLARNASDRQRPATGQAVDTGTSQRPHPKHVITI